MNKAEFPEGKDVIMFPYRLSLALMISSFVLVACTSGTAPTLAGVVTEPAQSGITKESSTTEFFPTATATQAPSSTSTPGTSPSAGEPTTTPTLPPFGEPNAISTATPRSILTRTPEVTPSPMPTEYVIGSPGFDWEGPGLVYIKDSIARISNFDGSQKSELPFELVGVPWGSGSSTQTGRIVSGSGNSLGIVDPGTDPRNILSVNQYIESPVITSDGTKIAYSLVHGFGDEDIQQLWTINPDGSENTLVIDDTGQYITDPGPFRLRPIAWSLDNTKVYMITTTDSEATPLGMYVADLVAGTIEKALTPQVTLWDVSFSADRTMIAYRTFQWVPVQDRMPEVGPPFTLQVTDLVTGETKILQESDTFEFFYPVWSEDGKRIAYTVRSRQLGGQVELYSIDLATGAAVRLVPGSEGSHLRPQLWISADRLAYTEEEVSSGLSLRATLYTIKNDGTDKHEIDSATSIVIGVLDN